MCKQWEQTNIYIASCTWMPTEVDAELIESMPLAFRAEFLDAYRSEPNWKPVGFTKSAKDLDGITWGKHPCPICGEITAAGSVYLTYRGEQTGIMKSQRSECPCARTRAYQKATSSLRLCHRGARLATLKPTDGIAVSPERQQKTINILRADCDHSFLVYGAPQSGKTHLAAGIFTEAVTEWIEGPKFTSTTCPAIFIDTATLLDEWMAYNSARNSPDKEAVIPTVTPAKAKAATALGLRPTLVLDDIHRLKPTEARDLPH